MRLFIRLLSAFFLCVVLTRVQAQMSGYYPKGGPDVDALDVSMIELIANPQKFNDKLVRITGFLNLEFEGDVIYLHEEDFHHGLTKNGLWVDRPRDISKKQIKAVNDKYVICTARFLSTSHGHMGMNSGELKDVSRLEMWPAYAGSPPPPKPRLK